VVVDGSLPRCAQRSSTRSRRRDTAAALHRRRAQRQTHALVARLPIARTVRDPTRPAGGL